MTSDEIKERMETSGAWDFVSLDGDLLFAIYFSHSPLTARPNEIYVYCVNWLKHVWNNTPQKRCPEHGIGSILLVYKR